MTFQNRLSQSKPILLDGATGSELEARGIRLILPLWSTVALLNDDGRKVLRSVHRDHIDAGAEIITANTFRTNYRALKKENMESQAKSLTYAAVEEVRRAFDESKKQESVFIAGSVATVEDCYSPELVPPDQALRDEHRRHIDHLHAAEVDVILIETINTVREAVIALDYARQTELPVLVSFVCKDPEHILSGEKLEDAVKAIALLNPQAILINCVPVDLIERNLEILQSLTKIAIGAYANVVPSKGNTKISPEDYARYVRHWIDTFHVKIAGGCCGTTPEHIRAIGEII